MWYQNVILQLEWACQKKNNYDITDRSRRENTTYAGRTCTVSFYFISFAKKNKQTNWKNVGRDTATAVANYSEPEWKKVFRQP